MADVIKATRVEILPGRMRVWLRMVEGAPRHTTPELSRKAVAAYPTLPLHSCINSHGPTFGDVIDDTSVPHLLEHLVIAEQVRLANAAGAAGASGAAGVASVSGAGDATGAAGALGAAGAVDATFVGTTEWVSFERGEAVTEVSFIDDLHAIASLRAALDFLNA